MAVQKRSSASSTGKKVRSAAQPDVREVIVWLEQKSSAKDLANLARFGIDAKRPIGVSMANLQVLANRLGRNHELAAALWDDGRYEARMLATLIEEPERVSAAQMERWVRDFDNWAIVDTACFKLFDQLPAAWARLAVWCRRRAEFERRAGFALLACLALHDRTAGDKPFLAGLKLIDAAADDGRNFVKKAVSWALRSIGKRSSSLNAAALDTARKLADSPNKSARWIGKGAVRELGDAKLQEKLAAKALRGS